MDSNHRPVLRGTDNAIWNRLHLIPFEVTIPPEDIDRELPGKLLDEAEGILEWAADGAVRWHRDGLGKPDKVDAASKAWRQDSDQIARFVEECCVKGDFAQSKARSLYSAYRRWADEEGELIVTGLMFRNALNERSYSRKHTKTWSVYMGTEIATEAPEGDR